MASGRSAFFEEHFLPLRISRLGEGEGFVTGYYEPVIDGSRTQTDVYTVPVYRRPSNLFVRGFKQDAVSLPNKGQVFRKIGRRKLVPYYDRAEIEDGVIAGRGLEICWLKNQTDLLFTQIQGSARVRLEDGSTIRINYDAHNGYPYMAVGRILIDRNIIPKDQMSMQKIREWMEQNPDGANELRRQNRSYVFFREVQLSDKDEAVGAQGVPLTPGRSIAVDKSLHVYGTPFFIEGELPIESEQSKTPFRRLMIAQDTGSAIVGPARADLYFGAGADAGKVSGRLRHNTRFVCWFRKVSIRWREAARCRCRMSGRRRKSQNCFRKQIRKRKGMVASRRAASAAQSSKVTANAQEPAKSLRDAGGRLPDPARSGCDRNRYRCRRRGQTSRRPMKSDVLAIQIVAPPANETPPADSGIVDFPRRRRALSEEERDLWRRRQANQAAAEKGSRPQRHWPVLGRGDVGGCDTVGSAEGAPRRQDTARTQTVDAPQPPPLAPLGRRERAHLARGRKDIDARIDLHGMTQTRAHRALSGFLQRAHSEGLTFVLVITGKGRMGAEIRARRAAPAGAAMAEPAGIPFAGRRL